MFLSFPYFLFIADFIDIYKLDESRFYKFGNNTYVFHKFLANNNVRFRCVNSGKYFFMYLRKRN